MSRPNYRNKLGVFSHICRCTCTHTRMHAHAHACARMHTHAHACTRMRTRTRTCTDAPTHEPTRTQPCTHTHTHGNAHTHAPTQAHTFTCTLCTQAATYAPIHIPILKCARTCTRGRSHAGAHTHKPPHMAHTHTFDAHTAALAPTHAHLCSPTHLSTHIRRIHLRTCLHTRTHPRRYAYTRINMHIIATCTLCTHSATYTHTHTRTYPCMQPRMCTHKKKPLWHTLPHIPHAHSCQGVLAQAEQCMWVHGGICEPL